VLVAPRMDIGGPWIWRRHIELSRPNREVWEYLVPFTEKHDAVILSSKDHRQKLKTPQLFFMPALDPFCVTNHELTREEIDERLDYYGIPTDLPLPVQISRFDRWKDPEVAIQAFRLARKEVNCALVLLGNVANDGLEGTEVYQRRAAVVLQKSIREQFGLTVADSMWTGTPVIQGNVGSIRYQIENRVNDFLVSSIEEGADKIAPLVRDRGLREQLGQKAKETVRLRFLLTRYLEQYLDLLNSSEADFRLSAT
jgi:trehalose synthase